jgi:hypothetical protein
MFPIVVTDALLLTVLIVLLANIRRILDWWYRLRGTKNQRML